MAEGKKPDFMMNMLSSMVGIPPEQFKEIIEGFIYTARNMGAQMDRIETNQLALIEAENDRRTKSGQPLIGYTDRDGSQRNRPGANGQG